MSRVFDRPFETLACPQGGQSHTARARRRRPLGVATRLYVNLAMADQAEAVATFPVDGVGLLRSEFMTLDALGGKHPSELIDAGGADEFLTKMSASLLRIARAFAPRPVIYRTYDFQDERVSKARRW